MPPRPITNDALWRFLCPNVRLRITRTPVAITRSRRATPDSSIQSHYQQSNCHFATIPTSHLPVDDSINRWPKLDGHEDFFSSHDLASYTPTASELTTAYEELTVASRAANYLKVQKQVEYLIKSLKQQPDRRIYDALLLANADATFGSPAEVTGLVEEMEARGITPDSGTYHAVLRALSVHPDHLLRTHVLQLLRQRWYSLTKDGYHDLIVGLIRERQMELALHYVEQMQKDGVPINSWLYDMLVYNLCNMEEFDEVLRLMQYRLEAGHSISSGITDQGAQKISGTVWYHILDTASRAMHYEATRFAYNARVVTDYLHPAIGLCNAILVCVARKGDTKLATSVFNNLSKRSGNPIQLHHYEALLEAYVNAHDFPTAITLLSTMQLAGHTPTIATTRPIFTYLKLSTHNIKTDVSILTQLRDAQRPVTLSAINVVLEGMIHHNQLSQAISLYQSIPEYSASSTPSPSPLQSTSPATHQSSSQPRQPLKPDTQTFNILIRGCNYARDKARAMSLTKEMLAQGVEPDALTYDRLVLCCVSCDEDLDDAWKHVEEMWGLGFQMRDGTRKTLVEKARKLGDERVGLLERGTGSSWGSRRMGTKRGERT